MPRPPLPPKSAIYERLATTKSRSQVHMLMVAAAMATEDRLSEELREIALKKAERLANGEGLDEADRDRVKKQRATFAKVPVMMATFLRAAMLQRAYDLMWEGDCLACDALVEFLPERDVDDMFDAWLKDQTGEPKSVFYRREYAP